MGKDKVEQTTVYKVDVHLLMDLLHEMYHTGVDFVDITVKNTSKKSDITLSYTREYIDREYQDNFPDDEPTPPKKIELTDDDINQLI